MSGASARGACSMPDTGQPEVPPAATAVRKSPPTFGSRLTSLRRRADLTRTQLAARLDTHESVIGRWERDENVPQPGRVVQLCRILHCSRKELCG